MVYWLKAKSKVTKTMKLFCEMTHTQFRTSMKRFRSDYVKGCFNSKVTSYFEKVSVHELSCVHTISFLFNSELLNGATGAIAKAIEGFLIAKTTTRCSQIATARAHSRRRNSEIANA